MTPAGKENLAIGGVTAALVLIIWRVSSAGKPPRVAPPKRPVMIPVKPPQGEVFIGPVSVQTGTPEDFGETAATVKASALHAEELKEAYRFLAMNWDLMQPTRRPNPAQQMQILDLAGRWVNGPHHDDAMSLRTFLADARKLPQSTTARPIA